MPLGSGPWQHGPMSDSENGDDNPAGPQRAPLDMLGALAKCDGEISDTSRLIEIITMEGLLSIWWHGEPGATDVALMCGGAAGGVLGPGRSLYLELGKELAAQGRAAMAIDYRRPGDTRRCVLDVCAAADLALRNGADRYVILGHSFGGAVAIQAAAVFPHSTAGVITYATQSAGCEEAAATGDVPLLLVHGDSDSILGPENSEMVRTLAGHGDVEIIKGADHMLSEEPDRLMSLSRDWIVARFDDHRLNIDEVGSA